MKKLAVIIGGWHYPRILYRDLANQQLADGWEYKFFVVGHRDPAEPAVRSEKEWIWESTAPYINFDQSMYKNFITHDSLSHFGYEYISAPNTIGDLEFLNQWLEVNDWRDYDMFLLAHDDTCIMRDDFIKDVLDHTATIYKKEDDGIVTVDASSDDNWVWLTNSTTDFYYHIRNSLDFITPEVIEYVGGRFNPDIGLTRVGQIDTPSGHMDLAEWNKWIRLIQNTLKGMGRIQDVRFLSKDYRVSDYAIEGERGMISNMNADTKFFLEGLASRGINP